MHNKRNERTSNCVRVYLVLNCLEGGGEVCNILGFGNLG